NVPFLALGVWQRGLAFGVRTLVAIALVGAWTEVHPRIVDLAGLPSLYAALTGNLLVGISMLILFRHNASMGGLNTLALLAQDRFGWPAGYVQLACDVVIIAAALTVASPAVVAASALGAGLLNLVLVMNHRPGRYLGASLGRRGAGGAQRTATPRPPDTSRHDDGASAQRPLREPVVRGHGVVEREHLGLDVHEARTGELEDLVQLAARAPVRCAHGGLVGRAEHPHGEGPDAHADEHLVAPDRGDRTPEVDRGLGRDEVEHRLDAPPVGHRADLLGSARLGQQDLVRADLSGELELVLRQVERDDPGRRDRAQHLDPDVTEPARADHDRGRAGAEHGRRGLDRVVRGQARVGERDVLHGVEVAEREQEAWVAHDHVVGHRAGRTEAGRGDPELGGTAAVVLLAARALGAPSATLRSVDGDRV